MTPTDVTPTEPAAATQAEIDAFYGPCLLQTATTMDVPDPADPARPGKAKGPRADRWRLLNNFVDCTLSTLGNLSDLKVWLTLFRDADRDGLARTSQADIAARAGVSEKTVGRSVRRLRAGGQVAVASQGGFPARVTVYRVLAVPPAGRMGRTRRTRQGKSADTPAAA